MKTNRDYFSWSQYNLWKQSKLEFRKKYLLGIESYPNKFFEKGKELGIYLEKGDAPHWADPLLQTVGDLVPKLSIMEHKIEVGLGYDKEEYPWVKDLLCYIDSGEESGVLFYEYKTGKVPWTQDKVNKHEQLDFYATAYYLKTGNIPKCKLIWVETEEVEEQGQEVLRYTGHVEEFTREFTIEEISNMIVNILTVLKEIDAWEYEEINIDNDKVERYIELTKQLKSIKSEIELIKLEVESMMIENHVDYATSESGKFSVSKRKSWSYSEKLNKLKSKYDEEISKKQIEEQKDGTAKISYSTSIRFSQTKSK